MKAADSSFFDRLSINYLTRYNSTVAEVTIHSNCEVIGSDWLA